MWLAQLSINTANGETTHALSKGKQMYFQPNNSNINCYSYKQKRVIGGQIVGVCPLALSGQLNCQFGENS